MSREWQKIRKDLRDNETLAVSVENTSAIVWPRQQHKEGLHYLGSSSQSTETPGFFQLVWSCKKGRGGPAVLGGLLRVSVLQRLSKQGSFPTRIQLYLVLFSPFSEALAIFVGTHFVEISSGWPRLVPR